MDTTTFRDLFIYSNDDTVFIYNDNFNRFTPLYVFNVNVGDTVCLPVIPDRSGQSDLRPNPFANGDTSFCFVIDSIAMVLYDTVYLETVFQHAITGEPPFSSTFEFPVYNWNEQYTIGTDSFRGTYARKIGGWGGGLLPLNTHFGTRRPTTDSFEYTEYGFHCYAEDAMKITIPTRNSSYDACFFKPFPVRIEPFQNNEMNVTLFPNPTKGKLQINMETPLSDNTALFLTDISGRILRHLEWPAGKMSFGYQINDLAPGMYFFVFSSDGKQYFEKVILMGQ